MKIETKTKEKAWLWPALSTLLLLLLVCGPLVDAADCGEPDFTFTKNPPNVVLDLCVTDTLTAGGDTKTLTVYYTTSNGQVNDQLVDIDTTGDGSNDMSPLEIAEDVWNEIAQAWTTYRSYGFRDPNGLDEFKIILADLSGDMTTRGAYYRSDYLVIDTPFLLDSLRNDPNDWMGTGFHEFYHAIDDLDRVSGRPKWLREGRASWAQDHVDLEVDNDRGGPGYFNRISSFFASGFESSITDISYQASIFWTYFAEQAGSITTEPQRGVDAVVDYIPGARAGKDPFDNMGELVNADDGRSFKTFFADFGTACYAKTLGSIPDEYRFHDSEQLQRRARLPYPDIGLEVDEPLNEGDAGFEGDVSMEPWSNRYFKIEPDAGLDLLSLSFRQPGTNSVSFSLLIVKAGDLIDTIRQDTGPNFGLSVINDGYEEVVMVVTSGASSIDFHYSINVEELELEIISPTTLTYVGEPSSPSKFLLKMQITDSSVGVASPIWNAVKTDFTITIGTVVVPSANILTFEYLLGQYWMNIRAPAQESGVDRRPLALRVDYRSLTNDPIQRIMLYAERKTSDNVVTIDKSGSMNSPYTKILGAKAAAKVYVNSFQTGDQIGVISFNGDVTPDLALSDWTETVRDTAITRINSITASGCTNLGDALVEALNQLSSGGVASNDWAIILLSDGIHTCGNDIAVFDVAYNTRRDSGEPCEGVDNRGCLPKVHTVAIGPSANRPDLEALSARTGGDYHFAVEPSSRRRLHRSERGLADDDDFLLDLAEIYRRISEKVSSTYSVFTARGYLPSWNERIDHEIALDESAFEAVIVLVFTDYYYYFDAYLFDPNGEDVTNTFSVYVDEYEQLVWRIPNPIPGKWKMSLLGESAYQMSGGRDLGERPDFMKHRDLPSSSRYLLEASAASDLGLITEVPVQRPFHLLGKPVQILSILSDSIPLAGGLVVADVISPSGQTETLTLRDDGEHGDGKAGDGIYGGFYPFTSEEGSYTVNTKAAGTSTGGSGFERHTRSSFVVKEATDTDGDGMPDWYEDEHPCLDKDVVDSGADPDLDLLESIREFEVGTDPCNSDTDGGGENDGSEIAKGRDPLDPADDEVPCFSYFHVSNEYYDLNDGNICRGAEASILHFSTNDAIDAVAIYRSASEDGFFTFLKILEGDTITGVYFDSNVNLGERYCYKIVGFSPLPSNLESCVLGPRCTIPTKDPLCSQGVSINNGAESTEVLDVSVNFFVIGAKEMRVSNSRSFEGTSWEPFKPSLESWTLQDTGGVGTVYVQYKDAHGGTQKDSGSIIIGSEEPLLKCEECRCLFFNGIKMYKRGLLGRCREKCVPWFLVRSRELLHWQCQECPEE